MKLIQDSSAMGQFGSAIAQICEEKGLEKDRVIETIEAALAAAYKKDYGKKGQLIIAHFKDDSGEISFKQVKEVVDDSIRNLENLEKIDEDRMADEAKVFAKAKKSKEQIDKPQSHSDEDSGEDHLPRFNIDRDILIKDAKAIKKDFKAGDFLEITLQAKGDYGRVASQTAKQVIIQRLREAERDSMYDEYKNKEGEVVNGVVQRIEGRNIFVDLGKSVGILFPSQQIPGEHYRIGQRIKVYIEKVESDPKGPGISLSRNDANLLRKLFELEVPEIFTGVVEIKAAAREAGSRSKIAVLSNEEGIDPIGSCVGQKGTRVQAVIDEIGGEKIDIIEWSDDIEKLIASALSPAKIVSVEIKDDENEVKKAIAFVPADQLSLAIGRSGQNVRLAAKLTGWKVDIEAVEGTDNKKEEGNDDREVKKIDEKVIEKIEEIKDQKAVEDKTGKEELSETEEVKTVSDESTAGEGEKVTEKTKVKKEKGKEKGSDSEEKVEDVKEEIIEDRPTSAKATAGKEEEK